MKKPTVVIQIDKKRIVIQSTRTGLKVQSEREDLTSSAFSMTLTANTGVKLVSGASGKQIKVYKAGYHSLTDGVHFFYFGTSTTPPTLGSSETKGVFLTSVKAGHYRQTDALGPDVGSAGYDLYFVSVPAESSAISIDIQYAGPE